MKDSRKLFRLFKSLIEIKKIQINVGDLMEVESYSDNLNLDQANNLEQIINASTSRMHRFRGIFSSEQNQKQKHSEALLCRNYNTFNTVIRISDFS